MKHHLEYSFDIRQSPMWGNYMELIGWKTEIANGIRIYIRTIPFFNVSMIKIQHPLGTIPFRSIDSIAKKYNTVVVIIEPHIAEYKPNLFKKNGYKQTQKRHAPSSTIKVDISSDLNTIFKSFSENARRNIKKAEKNNLILKTYFVQDPLDKNMYNSFDKLLSNLRKMKGFYAPGHKENYKKISTMKNHAILLFAYEKQNLEEPIAVVWFAYYKNVITYIQTGITKKGYRLLANYLLVWEGIKIAKNMDIKTFDFEAIYDPRDPRGNKKWKGYTEFKKRFHGEIIQYPSSWIKYYNKQFRIINEAVDLF